MSELVYKANSLRPTIVILAISLHFAKMAIGHYRDSFMKLIEFGMLMMVNFLENR